MRLLIAGQQLLVAPRSALTDELRALIRAQKQNILNELAAVFETERAARQAKVEAELRADPELRVAFDVSDGPLKPERREPVSVVLAVRHGAHILSGELHIPSERWIAALFLQTIDSGEEQAS